MIVLELNELTPSLIQRFMSEGKLPNFSRLYRESEVYTTTAAEGPPNLDPWIQWVTVHTGLNFCDHGIQRLNEGHTLRTPRVWDLLAGAGRKVPGMPRGAPLHGQGAAGRESAAVQRLSRESSRADA